MIHVGDITKLNGAELPVVDVITGGSPCQDLSNAGKRAGLAGERSGLFMDMVRVVKEMREHDRATGRTGQFIRPRYMVWENVPGAFSSNKGKDFQTALEEIINIVQETPDLPMPNGGWPKQGCIYDEMGSWSIAWRVHDAQFWGATQVINDRVYFRGTPQRRKRLALVADFGGRSAPEILFERKGLSWDSSESERERESTAGRTGTSVDTASGIVTKGNGDAFVTNGRHTSLTSGGGQAGQGYPCVMEHGKCLNPFEHQAKQIQPENGIANALYAGECRYGGGESYVLKTVALEGNGSRPSHHGDGFKVTDKMYSLNTVDRHAVTILNPHDSQGNQIADAESGVYPTLRGCGGAGYQQGYCMTEGNDMVCSYQERAGKPGGGKGILKQEDHVGALQTSNNQFVIKENETATD